MKLSFAIHDIHKNGGQERSTLEIVHFLAQRHEVEVLASSHRDLNPEIRQTVVPVLLRRPLVVKDFFFRVGASWIWRGEKQVLHHATGTCVFRADALTIQFLQKRWKNEIRKVHYVSRLKALKERIQVTWDYWWEVLIFWLNRNQRFFAISEQVAQDLKDLYGVKDVVFIPHGVNQQEFTPDREFALREIRKRFPAIGEKKILLFVGAFERKGLRTLLEALGKVSLPGSLWRLLVVGEGPTLAMQQLSQDLGISENVIFTGAQKEVALFFQAADLFVLPSHYDPFGLVGIEALACGCPAIVSQASGCSSLIRSGENGFVLEDSRDSQRLSQLIDEYFSKPSEHEKMREWAHQSTLKYNWTMLAEQYEQAFSQLMRVKMNEKERE